MTTLEEGIVVFQCAKCMTIVGDSSTHVLIDSTLKTITLTGDIFLYTMVLDENLAASCVTVSNNPSELITSMDTYDLGR